MVEIIGIETVFPGIDYVTLRGGQVVGIDKESVCLYHNEEAAQKCDSSDCISRRVVNPELMTKLMRLLILHQICFGQKLQEDSAR